MGGSRWVGWLGNKSDCRRGHVSMLRGVQEEAITMSAIRRARPA
jgi:hypothetical protein